MRTLVVVGANRAARIASDSARESNPRIRIIEIDPENFGSLSLDMDARALLLEDGDDSRRVRFDALILADNRSLNRFEALSSGRILPEFSFEVAKLALAELENVKPPPHSKHASYAHVLIDAGAIASHDGVLHVDAFMCTTLENVYACGSSVSVDKCIGPLRHRHFTASLLDRCAQIAGINAAHSERVDSLASYAGAEIIEIGNRFFGRTGLCIQEINQTFSSEGCARTTLFSNSEFVRLVASRESREVVSAEIVGGRELAENLNVLSLAVQKKMQAADIVDLDVPQILREAAQRLNEELDRKTESISAEKLTLWIAEGRPFSCLDVSDTPTSISRYVNATHLPVKDLEAKLSRLDLTNPLVVSSASGKSALTAYRLLKSSLGRVQMYHLEGGVKSLDLLLGGLRGDGPSNVV